mmetsp:Transcript_89446/g.154837  ORF Transcript_89446/g.154837 Transcript_89446/m.154837 type:complete len:291 (-) Transcript_89446:104-976(-)
MTLFVKNTFFDVEEPGEKVQTRRSSSAPPKWKPFDTCDTLLSDVSTADSDDEVSIVTPGSLGDGDGHDSDDSSPHSECAHEGSECAIEGNESVVSVTPAPTCGEAPPRVKLTLCLDDTVTSTIGTPPGRAKTKLSSKARAFAPVAAVDPELSYLVETMRETLHSSPDVLSVTVSDGIMGGSATVLAEVRSSCSCLGAATIFQMLCMLKATLLNAAAESETAYVLGYGAEPFQDLHCGFQATVGCVSPLQEHSVCWDTYEQGFCPRRNTCRWCHPLPSDLMQVVVMLKETE